MSEVFTWNHIEATLRNVFSRDKKGQEIFICKKLYFLLAVYVKNEDKKVEVAFLMHLSPVFFFTGVNYLNATDFYNVWLKYKLHYFSRVSHIFF